MLYARHFANYLLRIYLIYPNKSEVAAIIILILEMSKLRLKETCPESGSQ